MNASELEEVNNITPYRAAAKERVGIITKFHDSTNYGGVLQAYALHKTIRNLGFDCSLIRYSKNQKTSIINTLRGMSKEENTIHDYLLYMYNSYKRILKYLLKITFTTLLDKIYLKNKISLREDAFSIFNKKYIPSTGPYTDKTITESLKKYDIFVCGSDRIWDPEELIPAYFLDFVPDDMIKIAYAPSIVFNSLTGPEIERMRPLVNRLNAISVREKQGMSVVKSLTDKEVNWVLDPTLLLDQDEWKKVSKPCPIKSPYIFCYILGNNRKSKQFAINVAKRLKMPLVTLPLVAKDNFISLTYGDIMIYDAGPGEFLSLIQNAEYVITDSFHGSIFSIVFKKKFFALNRSFDVDRHSINSRLHNLLEICQLEKRWIDDVESIDSIDFESRIEYETAFAHLDEKRKQSMQFLITALHGRKSLGRNMT